MARTTACPICKQPATVTLFEQIDPFRGTEGHRIEFRCTDRMHRLSDADALKLWADVRYREMTRD